MTDLQKPKPVSPERFLKYHGQWAQEVATQTGEATDLYRDPQGRPACTLEGWPRDGVKVGTFYPQTTNWRRNREAKPAEAQAATKEA